MNKLIASQNLANFAILSHLSHSCLFFIEFKSALTKKRAIVNQQLATISVYDFRLEKFARLLLWGKEKPPGGNLKMLISPIYSSCQAAANGGKEPTQGNSFRYDFFLASNLISLLREQSKKVLVWYPPVTYPAFLANFCS